MDSRGHIEGISVMTTDEMTDDVADLIGSPQGTLLLQIANAPERALRVTGEQADAAAWLYDRGMIINTRERHTFALAHKGAQALVLLVDAIKAADGRG